jgi:SAM-dependent methyltransferase
MTDSVSDSWYENFFSGINCEMWEKAIPEDWTQKEVSFLVDVLQIGNGGSILDIPCGTGRLAMPLAKKGFQVTGVDISKEFIKGLAHRVKVENLSIQGIQGNILTLPLTGSFDGAYCMGNSFGYFDYQGMNVFIQKVAACLKPGSRFVINSGMLAESILPRIPPNKSFIIEDLTMHVENEYVVKDSYLVSHLTYTKTNFAEKHKFKHYVYTMGEIKRLLASAGLQISYMYNSFTKTGYELGDEQVYLIAEKVI